MSGGQDIPRETSADCPIRDVANVSDVARHAPCESICLTQIVPRQIRASPL